MTNLTKCAVCGVTCSQKCGGCKNIVYCSKEHQKLHWKQGHKVECKCYEVASNPLLGRHLRATRDIKQGEIFLRESPLIYGPKVACHPLCLGCHRTLTPPINDTSVISVSRWNYYKCSKCQWPLCGPQCEQSANHTAECQLMVKKNFAAKIDYQALADRKESAYCVILPLRCLLLAEQRPEQYKCLLELEDHLQERIDTPLYNILRANLITFIKTVLGLSNWQETEILRIAAILDTNAFEVRQTAMQRKVRAIYPNAAMISHDCISNVRHTFDENMQILFIAKKPIAKGEIIATSYTQPLKSTLMRRLHLSQAKCFDCTCQRCSDPTEMGTFIGAITCSECKIGKIISTNPLNNEAIWKCQLCFNEMSANQIITGNNALRTEIEHLGKTSPKPFEEFLYRYRDTLPEHNTHVLEVKYALTQLYGNTEGFQFHEMNDAALARKIELCQELLTIADLLDGGYSIFRGNLLLGLQECLLVQAKRDYLNGLLSRDGAKQKLLESYEILKEATEIMKYEAESQTILKERSEMLKKELEND